MSVSYTHLDVYKRQDYASMNEENQKSEEDEKEGE